MQALIEGRRKGFFSLNTAPFYRSLLIALPLIMLTYGASQAGEQKPAAQQSSPTSKGFRFVETFKGVDVPMVGADGKLTSKPYPDPLKWAFTFQPGIQWPSGYGDGTNWLAENDEAQTYVTPLLAKIKGKTVPPHLRYDPFHISEDGLHIRAAELTPEQQAAYQVGGWRRFGSGILLSRFSFQYGKVRVVAKLPNARGSWPAIWLLSAKPQWPPEIDILEAMAWGPHANDVHVGIRPREEDGPTSAYGDWHDVGAPLAADFHEYGLDWNEKTLTILFDGKPLVKRPTPPSMKREMVLLVNLAVGGKWAYNELGVKPTDGRSDKRFNEGADLIAPDYPADMIIKSISVESP